MSARKTDSSADLESSIKCWCVKWWNHSFLDNRVLKIFQKNTEKLPILLTVLCLSVCFAFSPPPTSRFLKRKGREREKRRRCYRWWIPLWTVSFPAECVQWARARSWNLANETHPPEGPSSSYWLRGWQRRRRLADGVLCMLLSERVANQTHSIHNQHGTPWRS